MAAIGHREGSARIAGIFSVNPTDTDGKLLKDALSLPLPAKPTEGELNDDQMSVVTGGAGPGAIGPIGAANIDRYLESRITSLNMGSAQLINIHGVTAGVDRSAVRAAHVVRDVDRPDAGGRGATGIRAPILGRARQHGDCPDGALTSLTDRRRSVHLRQRGCVCSL